MQRSIDKFRLRKRRPYEKRPAKNATSSFSVFLLFQKIFDKFFFRKSGTIFQLLPNFNYATKYYVLVTVGSKMAAY